MKKKAQRGLSWLLALIMALGLVSPLAGVPASAAEAQTYEIYPTPQVVNYDGGTVELPATLNAVFESDIDVYTKTRADEALANAGMTATVGTTINATGNLLVGVKGSGGVVDTYFTTKGWGEDALFTKHDAYQLVIGAHGIAVLGKDTDAAFYGLTTLKRILQQVEECTVSTIAVKDYADVPFRGFIEGYYGNPWSTEDRNELMRFGGELKMNAYVYAPKDDPKHRLKWRELYTPEELEDIKSQAKAGEASKCRFVYALHPFKTDPIRFDENYDADLAVVKAKLLQVIETGVRQISILADDADAPQPLRDDNGATNYVRLINDLTAWLGSIQGDYAGLKTVIPFVGGPLTYNGNGNETGGQIKALAKPPEAGGLPLTSPIIMTGGKTFGQVSNDFLSKFLTNTGRGPLMWINWPCTDQSRNHLVMGGYTYFLNPGLTSENIANIQGIMLNPMQQSEASQIGIFGNADYAWHIWPDDAAANKAWHDSFKYVDHMSAEETETSAALRELSKHMINQNTGLDESLELASKLTDFKAKLAAGTLAQSDITAMKAEFMTLQDAANLYLAEGRERLKNQIIYWLETWKDVTATNLALLDALSELESSDGSNASNSLILGLNIQAQAGFAKSKEHGFDYKGSVQYAEVGAQHIVPFTDSLLKRVDETAKSIFFPAEMETPVPGHTGFKSDNAAFPNADYLGISLNGMLDGSLISGTWFTALPAGAYVGVDLGTVQPLGRIIIKGDSTAPNDKMLNAILECSMDGETYTTIKSGINGDVDENLEGGNFSARYVRLRNGTAPSKGWVRIAEFMVLPPNANVPIMPALIRTTTGWTIYDQKAHGERNLTDGDDATFTWYKLAGNKTLVGDYIGVDLGRAVSIGKVRFAVGAPGEKDKWTNYKLEYSSDNSTWKTYKSYAGKANDQDIVEEDFGGTITTRYVRLTNTKELGVWVKFSEIDVREYDPHVLLHKSENAAVTHLSGSLSTNTAILSADSVTLAPGEYIGIVLPLARSITAITANNGGIVLIPEAGCNGNELVPVTLPLSQPITARYVRFYNREDESVTFPLTGLAVKFDPVSGPITSDPAAGKANTSPSMMTDGDLTTGFIPNMEGRAEGMLIYRISGMDATRQINVLQNGDAISNAVAEVRPIGSDKWIKIGTLDAPFNTLYPWSFQDGVAELRLSWENAAPTFYELVTIPGAVDGLDPTPLRTLLEELPEAPGTAGNELLVAYRDSRATANDLLHASPAGLTQQELDDAATQLQAAYDALKAADTTPPIQPDRLQGASADGRSITATWNASDDDSGAVSKYVVTLNKGNDLVETKETQNLTVTFTGLEPRTEYIITVVAYDAAGNASEPGAVSVTTIQAAPEDVAAINCTTADNKDGVIVGVNDEMEYKPERAAETEWKPITGDTITDLVPSKYLVRFAKIDTLAASASVTVEVLAYAPNDVNVALGKAVTASSQKNATLTADGAVDGIKDKTHRWGSNYTASDPVSKIEWLAVDLGREYGLDTIKLFWEDAYAENYKIQVSTDGNEYTDVATVSDGMGGVETLTMSRTQGRYVRIYCTKHHSINGNNYGYSILEVEIYVNGVVRTTINGSVVITGTAELGQTLTADVSGVTPADAQAVLTYQWYRGDAPIQDATGSTYAPVRADIGETIKVVVTGTEDYEGSLTSAPTAAVTEGGITPTDPYIITFVADGQTVETRTVEHGDDLPMSAFPAVPAKTGYTGAWDKAEDFTNVTENATVTAVYTANSYTVTFEPNGGIVDPESKTVTYDQAYGILPTPTHSDTDMIFEGWFTEGGAKVEETTLVTIADDHALYARWRDADTSPSPAFEQSTQTFVDADALTVTFTLTGAAADTYKVYAAAEGGEALADPTVSVEGTVLTLTFTAQPLEETTYYISATEDGKAESARTQVIVKPYQAPSEIAVTGVELDRSTMLVRPGNQIKLAATVLPEEASNKAVTWSSSNSAVATVDETGLVTGVADGTATITVKTMDGDYTADCVVTVETYVYIPPTTKTETRKNGDGSTTKIVTNLKTGTVTETTTWPDGTKIVTTTGKDGASTSEVTVPKDKDSVTVTIPTVQQPGPGQVAVIVKPDGTREIVKTSVATEDGMRVTLTEGAKLEIIDNSKRFIDVETKDWFDASVQFVASRELFTGTSANTFSPDAPTSRAMLMTVLARLDGQDTAVGETWDSVGMAWARENGISDGNNGESGITREQLALMLYRYAKAEKPTGGLDAYLDAGQVSAWAAEAMAWAVEQGIIQGAAGRLNPTNTATRAEVAAMLERFVKR